MRIANKRSICSCGICSADEPTRIYAPRGVIPYLVLKYGFSIPLATVTLTTVRPFFCSVAMSNKPIAEGEILCFIRSLSLSMQSSTLSTPTTVSSLSIPI